MLIKTDTEKTWIRCEICGKAWDVRKGGGCKCGNIRSEQQKDGSVITIGEDSDAVVYDNDR